MNNQEAGKRAVGEAAAQLVTTGMKVGLGTGSTAACLIKALGRRVREEDLRIIGTPTSFAAERLAREEGISLVPLDDIERLDIAFDGADEIDPALNLIKGRGGAHTREKVVEALADLFVVIADASKLVDRLGTSAPVPVEVLPMALGPVMRRLEALGARPELRMAKSKDGPVVSDQGFWIVDAHFEGGIDDLEGLNEALLFTPGVLDHGLFLGMAKRGLIGEDDGSVRQIYPAERA